MDEFDSFVGGAPVDAPLENVPSSGGEELSAIQANGSDTIITQPLDEQAFFSDYTPPAPSPPPVVPAQPTEDDPRTIWKRKNADVLKKKDAEESASKQQVMAKAKEYLNKFYEVRSTTLTTRKSNNRTEEQMVAKAEVPSGNTAWEKVLSVVNMGSGVHQKDVARYKSVLLACKTNNVSVKV